MWVQPGSQGFWQEIWISWNPLLSLVYLSACWVDWVDPKPGWLIIQGVWPCNHVTSYPIATQLTVEELSSAIPLAINLFHLVPSNSPFLKAGNYFSTIAIFIGIATVIYFRTISMIYPIQLVASLDPRFTPIESGLGGMMIGMSAAMAYLIDGKITGISGDPARRARVFTSMIENIYIKNI